MEDSLKSVIRVLVKVPMLIVVMYFCFNVIAFVSCYYKVMGAAYSLQQIAMENNYIPETELTAFETYIENSICYTNDPDAHSFIPYAHVVIFTEGDDRDTDGFWRQDEDDTIFPKSINSQSEYDALFEDNRNTRQQYGSTIYVGLATDFQIMWPLRYDQTLEGGGVAGYGNTDTNANLALSEEQLNAKKATSFSLGHIDVVSPVVGLQYYSDLASGYDGTDTSESGD